MNLYVWHGVLRDYTSGVAFAMAHDVNQARDALKDKYKQKFGYLSDRFVGDLDKDPTYVSSGPAADFIHGGG